jgi:hypothetical protein
MTSCIPDSSKKRSATTVSTDGTAPKAAAPALHKRRPVLRCPQAIPHD